MACWLGSDTEQGDIISEIEVLLTLLGIAAANSIVLLGTQLKNIMITETI